MRALYAFQNKNIRLYPVYPPTSVICLSGAFPSGVYTLRVTLAAQGTRVQSTHWMSPADQNTLILVYSSHQIEVEDSYNPRSARLPTPAYIE